MVDPCTGTFSVAKKSVMLPKPRQVFWCKIDSVCFNASLLYVAETFVKQVLNKDLDMIGSAEWLLQHGCMLQ